jgi:recombination protein RecA
MRLPGAATLSLPLVRLAPTTRWGLSALSGRLVEISGEGARASLTAAFGLVLEAQRRGDLVAWIGLRESAFFPPDAAEGGVDLASLIVVRLPDAHAAGRAADQLLRSGGFGLVVLDLAAAKGSDARVPTPLLTRLMGLAQKHDTALVFLTDKPADVPSMSSLISLRAQAARRFRKDGDDCEIQIDVQKDKRRGPGMTHAETCRAPAGLR